MDAMGSPGTQTSSRMQCHHTWNCNCNCHSMLQPQSLPVGSFRETTTHLLLGWSTRYYTTRHDMTARCAHPSAVEAADAALGCKACLHGAGVAVHVLVALQRRPLLQPQLIADLSEQQVDDFGMLCQNIMVAAQRPGVGCRTMSAARCSANHCLSCTALLVLQGAHHQDNYVVTAML